MPTLSEISGGEHLLWKSVSPMEISWNPSKYLPCCYLKYLSWFMHVLHYTMLMISMHLAHSQCPQSKYISYWLAMKFRFPLSKSYVMTEGNFLNGGISFSLRKSIRSNICEGNNRVQSVCFQARSLQINSSVDRPFLFERSKFEQQVITK